jgi:hypothetical protein
MKEARGLVVADLKGRIREWQEAYDMRPSEVKAILLELAIYFGPTTTTP